MKAELVQLDWGLKNMPVEVPGTANPLNKKEMTALQLVSNYNGFGIHTLFSVIRSFPGLYKNFVFASVVVIDQGAFKGEAGLEELKKSVETSLQQYVSLARKLGFPAEYRMAVGTDVVETATALCKEVSREFDTCTVFSGQLTFRLDKSYHKLLHNETAFAIQRHLQWNGITNVILPVRISV